MKAITAFVSILIMFVLIVPANAGGKGELQKHFKNVSEKVKAAENAAEKREILNKSFQDLSKALDEIQSFGLISDKDKIGIDGLKVILKENQDELAGINGYERVPDEQLNNFSSYVVQNMEQADGTVTISVIALVLIILLAVILF